ncbi:MAG: hypothetical protein KDK97_06005 [Verrucomicrobiales bacterium]|nr:hypothetical protein [Verrucomicrobiales bacterium]MCP5558073.1 hypothetical protein [Verrucomicrobiaceae bacterium]
MNDPPRQQAATAAKRQQGCAQSKERALLRPLAMEVRVRKWDECGSSLVNDPPRQ